MADPNMQLRPHGFVYPEGLPPCSQCGDEANSLIHVNPPKMGYAGFAAAGWGEMRIVAGLESRPRRSHVYTMGHGGLPKSLLCTACAQSMNASSHSAGMPSGMNVRQTAAEEPEPEIALPTGVDSPPEGELEPVSIDLHRHDHLPVLGDDPTSPCAACGYGPADEVHSADSPELVTKKLAAAVYAGGMPPTDVRSERQAAFVVEGQDKTLITAPASLLDKDGTGLPRELAAEWEQASARNPFFMFIEGRYVEADVPNRNAAMWTSGDLEMGEPSVPHGPVNWLHDERRIIGTITASKLVHPERQAAADGERSQIRALSALWPYIFPVETRAVAQASENEKLWISMECVSREVACAEPGCEHIQTYMEYMKKPFTRCSHVRLGGPRRFVDPAFLGAGIIIPPVRPAWSGANATLLKQAASVAERQAASFDGLETSEAEQMVAQVLSYAGGSQ